MSYAPREIEPKWQKYWLEHTTFKAEVDPTRPKLYILDMFPYPSGSGLHVGHPKGYVATDIYARYKRMRGFNVLHPMGWDAFGLPAEQHAVKTGEHPRVSTAANVTYYKQQLQSLGLSYDWDREIDTTDPRYMRWTQWIFCKLYERGLAYQEEVPVNWCPELGTVLANEEVRDGKSDIGSFPVVRVPLMQWVLKITAYAERLIEDLDLVDWPESIRKMQIEWIGRSEGARVRFPLAEGVGEPIEVFTTRPDTLFGATYMVLAPDHPMVEAVTSDAQRGAVAEYVAEAARKSERARIALARGKTGVFTGGYAINPVNEEKIPIWIADYVLISYGSGAIMAVPGHDERDYEFAREFGLPIVEVVSGGDISREAFLGEGVAVNSGFLNGRDTSDAKSAMIDWLEERLPAVLRRPSRDVLPYHRLVGTQRLRRPGAERRDEPARAEPLARGAGGAVRPGERRLHRRGHGLLGGQLRQPLLPGDGRLRRTPVHRRLPRRGRAPRLELRSPQGRLDAAGEAVLRAVG